MSEMKAICNFDANGVAKSRGDKVSSDELRIAGGDKILGSLVAKDGDIGPDPVAVLDENVRQGNSMLSLTARQRAAREADAKPKPVVHHVTKPKVEVSEDMPHAEAVAPKALAADPVAKPAKAKGKN